eukprot:772396-Pelagomonas_calceolata.AAC.1
MPVKAANVKGAISSGAASTPSRSMPKTTCSSKSSIAGTTRRPRLLLSHHSLHTNAYAYCSSHSTSQNALPLGNGLNKSSSTSSRRAGVRCQGLFDFLGGKGGAGGDKEGERARREAEEASKKRQVRAYMWVCCMTKKSMLGTLFQGEGGGLQVAAVTGVCMTAHV